MPIQTEEARLLEARGWMRVGRTKKVHGLPGETELLYQSPDGAETLPLSEAVERIRE